MTRVAVATTSRLAASAAAEVAELGGNAVDCAIAASLLTTNTEPGVCALAGGAYATVWPAGGEPITIDGNVAIPGRGLGEDVSMQAESVHMEYGGGIETMVGGASVAVPGTLAAYEMAWRRFGSVPWRELFGPSIRAARDGFRLSAACHYYLCYSGEVIYGRSDDGFAALHDADGALRPAGSRIVVPHLADSLATIAEEGARAFYNGDLAATIAQHVRERGGLLTRDDLGTYEARVRSSLTAAVGDWTVATNPPPAVGGAVLCAMLLAFAERELQGWDAPSLEYLVSVQAAVLRYRRDCLDLSDNVAADVERLLKAARSGSLLARRSSSSTVHTSVVDDAGLACAITASSGYGSGEMPAGTGLWLNNCLGEIELNRRGLDAGPPGARLPSNMAPSAARSGETVLAAGSPGADRITTALHQFLINYIRLGLPLEEAVAHPRVHLEVGTQPPRLAVEPGLELPQLDVAVKRFPEPGMYFGGVAAASYDPREGFRHAADPRREGGTCVAGR